MKRILLASAACLALSLPAISLSATARTSATQPNPPPQTQSAQPGDQHQAKVIEPSSLNKEQIREVQMKLNKDGFSAGHVDGVWGPDTDRAVMEFRRAKNLPGDGKLNEQTLADLGVKLNNQSASSSNKNEPTGSMSNKNEGTAANTQTNTQGASTSDHSGSTTNKTGSNTKTTP